MADVSRAATLTIGRLTLQSLSLSSSSTIGGSPVAATLTLSAPAPDGGLEVTLASNSQAAIVPARTTIPAGESAQTFAIATIDTPTPTVATITATLPYSGSARDATLTIARLGIQQVSLGISAVPGGVLLTGTISLSVTAPATVTVALSSSEPVSSVPATVTIAAGTMSQTFDVTTVNSPPTRTATITATYAGTTRSVPLTVIAFPIIPSLSCSSTTPKVGTSVTCTGTLSDPAPAGGWQLTLTTSDSSIAGPVPDGLTVPASSQTFQFAVVTAPTATTSSAVIRIVDAPSGLPLFSQAFTITP